MTAFPEASGTKETMTCPSVSSTLATSGAELAKVTARSSPRVRSSVTGDERQHDAARVLRQMLVTHVLADGVFVVLDAVAAAEEPR